MNYRELSLNVEIDDGKWFYCARWQSEEAGSEYGFETEEEALKAGKQLIDSWWESEHSC